MIALKFKQEIIASAITIPPSRLTAIAIKNEGVIFNHHPFVLPSAIPLDQVTLVSESGKVSQSRIDYQHLMERIYSQVRSIRRFGCIASHVQLLNSGHFHFGLTVGADTHDLFPISLIYRECGYQLFNQSLSPWTINDSTLIVVHPVLTTPVTHLLANQ